MAKEMRLRGSRSAAYPVLNLSERAGVMARHPPTPTTEKFILKWSWGDGREPDRSLQAPFNATRHPHQAAGEGCHRRNCAR
ncbi:hypothetical protein AGR4B_pAt20355 [Agrobacterium tumefaciens str. CFBP 5621]|nr:hypothetical protein AGR4B_pAt20355 [Agrobacterium tumefaciens str. CFBP 5621]